MAISYTQVGWDTSKYVNPTNMNQMDNGIKAACDGVDTINGGTITGGTIALTSDLLETIVLETEKEVGTYDGKTLYRMSFEATVESVSGYITSPLPVTAQYIVNFICNIKSSGNSVSGIYYVSASDMARVWFERSIMNYQNGSSYPTLPVTYTITVYYTKS